MLNQLSFDYGAAYIPFYIAFLVSALVLSIVGLYLAFLILSTPQTFKDSAITSIENILISFLFSLVPFVGMIIGVGVSIFNIKRRHNELSWLYAFLAWLISGAIVVVVEIIFYIAAMNFNWFELPNIYI